MWDLLCGRRIDRHNMDFGDDVPNVAFGWSCLYDMEGNTRWLAASVLSTMTFSKKS